MPRSYTTAAPASPMLNPYNLSPESTRLDGFAPSFPLVKLYRVVNRVPSVFNLKTAPYPPAPPYCTVPYRVFPETNNANGKAPSALVPLGITLSPPLVGEKLWRLVNPPPLVLIPKTTPEPLPPCQVVPYNMESDITNEC